MPPYPPVGNIPVHQSRQEPPLPHLHPSGGMPPYPMHSFRPDAPMGHFETGDHRPPPAHSMEYMGADRMPYSYGGEQGGPRPFLEQPSPRTWPPEVSCMHFRRIFKVGDYRELVFTTSFSCGVHKCLLYEFLTCAA